MLDDDQIEQLMKEMSLESNASLTWRRQDSRDSRDN